MAGGGRRGASSRASPHLPGRATLSLSPGSSRKAWETEWGLSCDSPAGEAEAGSGVSLMGEEFSLGRRHLLPAPRNSVLELREQLDSGS